MVDREKVIKALERCATKGCGCDDEEGCPYNNGVDYTCVTELVNDALALLKAQEARIVTEADFKNADEAGFIPAWCEEKDTGEVYCECILIGALEDAKFGHMRWWTSRPDDAAREATPWE